MAERAYVALDLETTGLDQTAMRSSRSAVKFSGDRVIDRFKTLVNPQRAIPASSRRSPAFATPTWSMRPPSSALPEVLAFVDSEVSAVIAHNADFDLGFLRAAGVNFRRPAYDTVELATILLPGAAIQPGELCLRFGIPPRRRPPRPDDARGHGPSLPRVARPYACLLPAIVRLIADAESAWPLAGFFAEGAALLADAPPGGAQPAFQRRADR